MLNRMIIKLFFIFILFLQFSCGYSIYGRERLPFNTISIEKIDNNSYEPKLQDKLYVALTEEFLRQGISVIPNSDYKISGRINHFDLRVLSESSDVAIEYEVLIDADFKLIKPSGEIEDFKKLSSPFIVSFSGMGKKNLEFLIAQKEYVSERALKDIAIEIVSALIYSTKKDIKDIKKNEF